MMKITEKMLIINAWHKCVLNVLQKVEWLKSCKGKPTVFTESKNVFQIFFWPQNPLISADTNIDLEIPQNALFWWLNCFGTWFSAPALWKKLCESNVSDFGPNISAGYFRLFLAAAFYPRQHGLESNSKRLFFGHNCT